MAKIWNFWSCVRRTQQAALLVAPSHGMLLGFTKLASRVSPRGNCEASPRSIQEL